MVFKVNWEKASAQHQLSQETIAGMVQQAFSDKQLVSYEIIAGGCVNVNVSIMLSGEKKPFILRVYLRDKEAAYREKKLGELIGATVPIPQTYYIGDTQEYRFAFVESMPGVSLRDLLLGDNFHDTVAVMHEVGVVLGNISAYTFSKSGFFYKDLNSIESPDESLVVYAKASLESAVVVAQLNTHLIARISKLFDRYGYLLFAIEGQGLVHGDFDPANIFVDNTDGVWRVSAILDWEFAFSGSPLWDIANMLRYAHKMPSSFEHLFIEGCVSSGIVFPKNWQTSIHLLNVLSLLDCLKRSDCQTSPDRCADIRELIDYIVIELEND